MNIEVCPGRDKNIGVGCGGDVVETGMLVEGSLGRLEKGYRCNVCGLVSPKSMLKLKWVWARLRYPNWRRVEKVEELVQNEVPEAVEPPVEDPLPVHIVQEDPFQNLFNIDFGRAKKVKVGRRIVKVDFTTFPVRIVISGKKVWEGQTSHLKGISNPKDFIMSLIPQK